MPDDLVIDIEQMRDYPDEKLVLITTGSQGEAMAVLGMAYFGFVRAYINLISSSEAWPET